jgi:hypothetical protein
MFERDRKVDGTDVPSTRAAVTPERVLAGVSLAVPVVALLCVPSYSRSTPELVGMPFFYWYQLLWVPASAVFTWAAYLLLSRDEKRRAAHDGGDAR